MSLEYMVRAFNADVGGNSLRKLILVKLGDNANDKGTCYPSYQHIADQCECSRRSAIKQIHELVGLGLVKIIKRGDSGKQTSNLYQLILTRKASEPNAPAEKTTSECVALAEDLPSERGSPPSERGSPLASERGSPESATLFNQSVKQREFDSGGRKIFPMFSEWEPTIPKHVLDQLSRLKITKQIIKEEVIRYRIKLMGKPGDKRTDHNWSTSFVSSLMRFAQGNQKAKGTGIIKPHPAAERTSQQLDDDKYRELELRAGALRMKGVEYEFDPAKSNDDLEREISKLEVESQYAEIAQ